MPFSQFSRFSNTAVLLLALLFAQPLPAQDYIAKVEHYGVEQGLSHRQANAIFEDSRGFVWIGTPNGLNRFDGYGFRTYTKEKDGLLFNDIQSIKEDADGWLWLVEGGRHNICLFQPERGEVRSLKEKFGSVNPAFASGSFNESIWQSEDGALWLSATDADWLYRYHPKTGIQVIRIEGLRNIRPAYFSAEKTLWATADGDLLLELDQSGKVLQRFENLWLYGPWALSENGILAITRSWPGKEEFFYCSLKRERRPLLIPALQQNGTPLPALIFPFDDKGSFVIHDRLMDPARGEVAQWEFVDHDKYNFMWRSFLKDRSGRYWLGDDFGFYILQIKKNRFQRYFFQKGVKPGLGNSIRGILTTPDHLYANIENGGCFELDLHSGQSRRLEAAGTGWGNYSLTFSKNGDILSGREKALYRFSPDASTGEKIPTEFNVWAVCEDNTGKTWIGSASSGLHTLSPGASSIQPFTRYNEFGSLATAFVLYIEQDKSGVLWACASNGFYKIDPQKGVVARYWSGGTGEYFLPADNFYHFHLDADGVFWLASATGLVRVASRADGTGTKSPAWDLASGKLFNRASGLPNEVIYAVYEDRQGRLWLPTDRGIICMDKKTGGIKTYFVADGITDSEFNRTAHFQDKNGVLYFGSLNGITAFNPADFNEKEDEWSDTPLELTAFQQFDHESGQLVDRTAELLRTREIVLRPDERFFNLELALLSYNETNLIQYAWKIEGLDKDWHYQKERHLNYSGLPYGNYTLRIKAQASDGQWSKRMLTFTIRVLRPWYLQGWFLALAVLLACSGIFVYVRRRNRQLILEQKRLESLVAKATERIEKQAEELRHLDEVKSRFFANVSHELRTPLSLLLGPISSVLKGNRQDNRDFTLLKLAQMHGQQLLQLVNQILDLSKLESGKLELQEKPTALYPLLRRIVAAFESHAERKGIQFVFQYQAEKNLQLLVDSLKLETILNNLLSNALKFTPAGGTIQVVAENLANAMRIGVSDTGRGIHPDDLPKIFDRFYQSGLPGAPTEGGTGIGLALCRELAELMGGKISAESAGLGEGSRFFFEFPLKEVLGKTTDLPEEAPELVETGAFLPLGDSPQPVQQAATLLIVEDNVSLRDYLKLTLPSQYRVITAENGQEALGLMHRLSEAQTLPDLIISDIMMPVMDGFQFLEHLKNDPHFRVIPVIMLTARADMQDKLRALRIGVDDYLLKPFEEEELLVRISTLLERYGERRQSPNHTATEENQATTPEHSAGELAWLADLENLVVSEAQNDLLSVSWIADRMHLSERQFQRRLKNLTGLSPNAYLNEVRLQEARRLLEQGKVHSVKELAWTMSFRNEKYFSQIFRERFGKTPSELLR